MRTRVDSIKSLAGIPWYSRRMNAITFMICLLSEVPLQINAETAAFADFGADVRHCTTLQNLFPLNATCVSGPFSARARATLSATCRHKGYLNLELRSPAELTLLRVAPRKHTSDIFRRSLKSGQSKAEYILP